MTVVLSRRQLCQGELVYTLMAIDGGPFEDRPDAIPNNTEC